MLGFFIVYSFSALCSILIIKIVGVSLSSEGYAYYSYFLSLSSVIGLLFFSVYRFVLLKNWAVSTGEERKELICFFYNGFFVSGLMLMAFLQVAGQIYFFAGVVAFIMAAYDFLLSYGRVSSDFKAIKKTMVVKSFFAVLGVGVVSVFFDDVRYVLFAYVLSFLIGVCFFSFFGFLDFKKLVAIYERLSVRGFVKYYRQGFLFVINSSVLVLMAFIVKKSSLIDGADFAGVISLYLDLVIFSFTVVATALNMIIFSPVMAAKVNEEFVFCSYKFWIAFSFVGYVGWFVLGSDVFFLIGDEYKLSADNRYYFLCLVVLVAVSVFKTYGLDNLMLKMGKVEFVFFLNLFLLSGLLVVSLIDFSFYFKINIIVSLFVSVVVFEMFLLFMEFYRIRSLDFSVMEFMILLLMLITALGEGREVIDFLFFVLLFILFLFRYAVFLNICYGFRGK